MVQYIALVPAAGAGTRFGTVIPKQYLSIRGKPLLWYTLNALENVPAIGKIIVVISPQDKWFNTYQWSMSKLQCLPYGGTSRALSVRNGLTALLANDQCCADDWLLVHDAARCCLRSSSVTVLINQLANDDVGGLMAVPVPDTVKRSNEQQCVETTIPRESLWLAQTPQMFRVHLLKKAFEQDMDGLCTDEASAVEQLGFAPRLIRGDIENIKLTYPEDVSFIETILFPSVNVNR